MGRTPDFSVRGTTGPAGVEGEGRAASFELPSPSLSSKKAPSSRLLDLQVGPRLLERLRRTSFLRLPRRRPPRPHTPGPRSAPRPRAPSPAAAPHRRAPRLRAIAAAAPSAPRRDPSPGPAPRRRASRLRATAAAARPRAVAVAAARPRAAARLRAAAAAGSLPGCHPGVVDAARLRAAAAAAGHHSLVQGRRRHVAVHDVGVRQRDLGLVEVVQLVCLPGGRLSKKTAISTK